MELQSENTVICISEKKAFFGASSGLSANLTDPCPTSTHLLLFRLFTVPANDHIFILNKVGGLFVQNFSEQTSKRQFILIFAFSQHLT